MLKNNTSQVTFVVAGAIVFELIYGSATEALWSAANEGVRPRVRDAAPPGG